MDDDIVLNLDLGAGAPSKTSSKKGGRWVDRLKVKRAVKRKAQTQATGSGSLTPDVLSRPPKRPRRESNASTSSPQLRPNLPLAAPVPPRPTQFVSSLFTSNPKLDIPTITNPTSKLLERPSNAPLDALSFSGLGLHPLLVSHLMNKMNIKKPTAIQRSALPPLLASSDEISGRDVFIQSQTGSGKTLSYLLPIIHDLLPLSSLSYIDRSIGTLAIIIAPTRELAKQISDVLEALLKLRLRAESESADDPNPVNRLTRWLVSGLLIGGENRTHEKARLRKGVPILVTTPGRLLDHLQNTSSFNVGKCRWLVLDEADRLMELGFEQTITGILKGLEGRHRLAKKAVNEGKSTEVGGWDWGRRRRTILCSATIREDVQKLAGSALVDPLVIRAVVVDKRPDTTLDKAYTSESFTPPSQLAQKYIITPLKLRLVTLIALLRSLVAQVHGQRSNKVIVFFSCTDSVDFHWNLLTRASMGGGKETDSGMNNDDKSDEEGSNGPRTLPKKWKYNQYEGRSPLFPDTSVYRLHGSLPTQTRLSIVKSFSEIVPDVQGSAPSVLLCTSVASRGLDLPLVRAVLQYDLPTEGGATEYVHRVGRTARAGKGGEAWSIVAPSECDWVHWVQEKMDGGEKEDEPNRGKGSVSLTPVAVNEILRSGFGGKGQEFEERATEVQLAFERWVLREKENSDLARSAFLSHLRAYATHPSSEKHIFHIRHLHLGHLAKAFALREAPKSITGAATNTQKTQEKRDFHSPGAKTKNKAVKSHQQRYGEWEIGHSKDAEKRMQAMVRAQGRLTKKGGVMMSSGASEFQITGGDALEKLVQDS